MDSEQKFWCTIWTVVAMSVIIFATVIVIDDIATMNTINNMVKNGSSAQDAACAVKQSTDNCILARRK